jgi:exopolyphosphatase/guanosine-5'-triphosphate,3'-diphosphate pyrophosphatase
VSAADSVRVAAIDCGTNSLRLLITDLDLAASRLTDVDRRMEIVRLGQGVDATGLLAPESLTRTFRALEQYAAVIGEAGAQQLRMVATSATRDAVNADEFVAGVTRILGTAPEVLTGDEEALLSFTGATAELSSTEFSTTGSSTTEFSTTEPPEPPYLVVDIGGGSTEFVCGPDPVAALSVDIGCVRLTERYLHGDPPAPGEIAAAAAAIDAALDTVAEKVPVATARTLIGLAGSVTTVTGIALGLSCYDPGKIHHAVIPAPRVHSVTASLLGQTRQQRASIGLMHPGRADVIGAGALVLDRILTRLRFASVMASEHDILDGIAWSMVTGRR